MEVEDEDMLRLAALFELTVILMLLLLAVDEVTQFSLLVKTQLMISPLANAASVYNGLLIPTLLPFFFHWYVGAEPPLEILAVNLTLVPLQMEVASALILMVGVVTVQNTNPPKLPVPIEFVTAMDPLLPAATIAVIDVELTTVKEPAAVPPMLTAVAPVKLVPVMVMVSPVDAITGVKDVMVGEPDMLTMA